MDFPSQIWAEKPAHEVETHWLSSKEKVQGAAVSKEDHAESVLGPNSIAFLEKGATVDSASYHQLFRHNSSYLLNDSHIYIYIYIYI